MKAVNLILLHSLYLLSCTAQTPEVINKTLYVNRHSQLDPSETEKLDSISIDYQFRGSCYAYSSDKNAVSSNGEAHSRNLAQPVDDSFIGKGVFLCVNTFERVKYNDEILGHKMYLVNKSNEKLSLGAQDSRLNIIEEAMDENGEWKPISYLPSSWCGNSYHTVVLDKDEFWEFTVPIFKGSYKTKMRYTLLRGKDQDPLYSNIFEGYINPNQFDEELKEGHTPTNIMDSYND